MLTKLFNAAALVKDFITDTSLAPLDAYKDFKNIFLYNFTKQGKLEPSNVDKAISTVAAINTSAVSVTGIMTFAWAGLLGTSMTVPTLIVSGAVVGFAATGVLGRSCWAIANRNASPESKDVVHSYADTVVSFKRLMA